MPKFRIIPGSLLALGLLCGAWYATADSADKATATKVARVSTERSPARQIGSSSERTEYVLGASPAGPYADNAAMYEPIADFLTRVTGKRFVYRYSDNWLSYSKNVTGDAYDLVFDSAPLTSWSIERINHTPLLRLSEDVVYVVVARADNRKINQLKQLAGHAVCAPLPPHVATLTLLSQFENPARQPIIVGSDVLENAYNDMVAGKCVAAVMSNQSLEHADRKVVKVLYQHRAMPNQALTASSRIPAALQAKIRDALLTPQGQAATAKLRAAYGSKEFVPARGEDYAGLGKLLKDSLYYY